MTLRPRLAFAFSHPAHAVALGFGAGLAPFAPGTAGTLLGWLLGGALVGVVHPGVALALIAALFALGVWACALTGEHLGVHDHGAMVWDEVVAFLLVLVVVPASLAWQAAAFVLFRFFDIVKPWPIREADHSLAGGLGIMLDDIIAGIFAAAILLATKLFI